MSERGTPATEGAAACPFVAFDDDRDARSTAPDHRHRCFAEPIPAPRAIAHQDAYCLSPAFAVCPSFQDWARREAAAARPAAGSPASAIRPREEDASRPVPMPPAEREPRHAPEGAGQPLPQRRQPARDWAAPPPWAAGADAAPDAMAPAPSPGAIPGWGASPSAPSRAGDFGSASRGLADSRAARMAGPDPALPAPARPVSTWGGTAADADDDADLYEPEPIAPLPPVGRQPGASRSAAPLPGRPAPPARGASTRDAARPAPAPREAGELFGPAWERPRRYEAYPSLRTRVGLPSLRGIPTLGLAAIALVIAAAFLFFVSPMILGLGKDQAPAASAAPSAVGSAAPSETPAPTVPPAPTPVTYTVVAGDTISGIAQKFGITSKALLKANPQIKNQNAIQIGDVLTIPPPAGSAPGGAVTGASPSPVQGASTNP